MNRLLLQVKSFGLISLFMGYLTVNSQVTWNWNNYPTGSMSYNQTNGSCSLNTVISGSDFAQTPRYTASYGTGLLIDHNWTNTSSSTSITLTFNTPITNPSFQIRDINQNGPCMGFCSSAWDDKVTVSINSGTISASSANPVEHTITGNGSATVTADANLVCNSTNAAVTFTVSGSITSITITYLSGNNPSKSTASGSPTPSCGNSNESLCFSSRSSCPDPGRQYIAIGEISGTMCCSGGSATINAGNDQSICSGQPVTLNASGGSSYSWNNGVQNGVAFYPTATTTYTVTGTSSGGCTGSDNVTVTVKPLPNVLAGPDLQICLGESVTLNGTGANSYSWTNGVQNGIAFSPTSSQTYSVTGTASNGCSATDQVSIIVNSPPNVFAGNDITICAGQSVTLTATGASSISWNGNIQNNVAFVPGNTASYIVTGMNGTNCIDKDTVLVTVNPLPVIQAGNDTSVCSGASIWMQANGGINYQWSNSVQNGTYVTALQSATYTVTGTNSNNCIGTDSRTITILPGVTIFAGNDTTICLGSNIQLNGSGASTLNWSGGLQNGSVLYPSSTVTYQLTSPAIGLQCPGYDEITITVRSLPTLQVTPQVACYGDSVTFNASGAQQYQWSDGIFNGVSFAALQSLTPQVIGIDSFGCRDSIITNLTVNALPNVYAGPDQVICPGNSVTLLATGALSYSWNDGSPNGSTITPIQSAIYSVIGTDNNGCIGRDSVTITVQQGQLAVNAGNDQYICAGTNVVLNATGALNYTWDHAVQNNVPFQVAQTDTFTVNAVDANGCSGTDQVIVFVNNYPTFQLSAQNPTQCSLNDGQILLTGLTPGTNYMVSYNGNPNSQQTIPSNGTLTFTNLSVGNYSLFTVGLNGCNTIDSSLITLIPPSSPMVFAGNDQQICEGDTIQLEAQTSVGATLNWSNNLSNNTILTPTTGSYMYIAEAVLNGCSTFDTMRVLVRPNPIIFAGNDLIICEGETVLVTASGGSTYTWTGGIVNGASFTPIVGLHNYVVSSTNMYGCIGTDSLTITVKPNPIITLQPNPAVGCLPFTTTFITQGNAEGQCLWSINGELINGTCDSLTYQFTEPGCFDVSIISNLDGCTTNSNFANIICTEEPPISQFSTTSSGISELNNVIDFINLSSNASSYEWDFGDQTLSYLENPSHQYQDVQNDTIQISLIAFSPSGCSDTSYQLIPYKEDLIFWVPNAFTPDNDGTNDVFSPVFTAGYDPFDYSLFIFNRWGEILFESHDVSVGWKGTYGGELMQDDVYTWKISFKTKYSDEHKVIHGHATLLK